MVLFCLDGIGVAVDEVGGVVLAASGRGGLEPDGLDPVGGPVDDKVVALLEDPATDLGIREQQPVQVEEQTDVQGAPVLGEEVVEGGAVAGELLFAAGAQLDGPIGDDGSRRLRLLTTTPSRADDAVMLATRARLARSVSRPGT